MRSLLSLFILFFSTAAGAGSFTLVHDGSRITGGEICMYEAVQPDDPLHRYVSFSSVTCHPADSDVKLPPGAWNLFGRHRDGLVSSVPLLVNDGNVSREASRLPLVGARSLPFPRTGDDLHRAVYLEETGIVIPLPADEEQVLVPDGTTVFPLHIRAGSIVGVGEPLEADRGGALAVPPPAAGRRDVAVGLLPDSAAFARLDVRRRAPGRIELTSAGATFSAFNRPQIAFTGTPGLALFRGVRESSDLTARVTGEGWFATSGMLKGPAAGAPLRIAPATTLTIHWRLMDDVVALAAELQKAPPCPLREKLMTSVANRSGTTAPGLTLTLEQCSSVRQESGAASFDCRQYAVEQLDPSTMAGRVTLRNIPAGDHFLRLAFGGLPPAVKRIRVERDDDQNEIELRFDRFFGKVTKGGEPLHAVVALDLRTAVATDPATGEYFTIGIPQPLRPPPSEGTAGSSVTPVFVYRCDEDADYVHIEDEPRLPNSRFDIELPSNVIKVRVIDAASGSALPDAMIRLSVMKPGETSAAHYSGNRGVTDAKGELTLHDVPVNRALAVCASRSDYHRKCEESFTMELTRERSVSLQLERAEVRQGRVSPLPVNGQILWYRLDGTVAEIVQVAADGAFSYKEPHTPGETVAVVSGNLPLYVLRYPELEKEQIFEIVFPAAPVRSFDVRLTPALLARPSLVSLSIDGIVVPASVFSGHLARRGIQTVHLQPLQARDILATGPIIFIAAPREMLREAGNRDVFYIPEARTFPRKLAGAEASLTIGD
jgi:hypothetical protein